MASRTRIVAVVLALVGIFIFATRRGADDAPAAVEGSTDAATTVVLVRHAERADDGTTRDPDLSDAGRERAAALAETVTGLDAIYATQYRRTQQTAAPLAERSGVPVTTFDVEGGAEAYAEAQARRIREEHAGEAVLVVSHSNTVARLAAELAGAPFVPLDEDEYDRIIVIVLDGDAEPRIVEARFGAPSGAPAASAAAR